MTSLRTITEFLTSELRLGAFEDSSVNGLQFEGASEVSCVAVAVDAGLSVIEEAARRGAQFLLVHHGLFWGGSIPIVGPHRRAVGCMVQSGLSLFAAHLPLDAHPTLGNNYGLARILGLTELTGCAEHRGALLGVRGKNSLGLSLSQLEERLKLLPGGGPMTTLAFGAEVPKSVCVVTGSAADQLYRAESDGFDTLISGEPRQMAYHLAKERGLNAIFAGHYRTETIGVRLVGEELVKRFGVTLEFIDEPTGI